MSRESIKAISDIFTRLRPLLATQFSRPLKDMEKSAFPHGYKNILWTIMSKGGSPISMTDLATASCMAKPNLTTIVDKLLMEGLVERSTDKSDRRIVNIGMTEKGKGFLAEQKKFMLQFMEEKLSVLAEDDLDKLKSALEDIAEVVGKM